MKTLQQIADRIEIEELFIKYSYAIDERNLDELDEVFLPDAIIDNTGVGGHRLNWCEMKPWLAQALSLYAGSQHLTTSTKIEIKGDEAFTKTICFNPMVTRDHGGVNQDLFFVGLWYIDHLVRTPAGWRIKERREDRSWFFNANERTMPTPPKHERE